MTVSSTTFSTFPALGLVLEESPDAPDRPLLFADDDRHDTLAFRSDSYALAAAEIRAITLPAGFASSEWKYLIVKAVGEVQVQVTGLDYDGVTAITSYHQVYGTIDWPGIFTLATYNVTNIQVVGVAANSTVETLAAIICTPTDARLP